MSSAEDVAVCPYNRAHSIVMHRMQFHLRKCRLQHPNAEKITCPFNSTHIINKVELDFHLNWCENRVTTDKMYCKVGSESPFVRVPVELPVIPKSTSAQEEWDVEEATGHSVLEKVKEVSLSKPTLHNKICATRSERKAHKMAERQRFQQVLESKAPIRDETKKETYARVDKINAATTGQKPEEKSEKSSDSSCPDNLEFPPRYENLNKKPSEAAQCEMNRSAALPRTNEETHRDPKNPWGSARPVINNSLADVIEDTKVELKNSVLAQKQGDENHKPSNPAWGGWSKSSTSPDESVSNSFHQMKLNDRDPGNPWKMKNIAANFQGDENNDFPVLPMSGMGRGRRMPK